MSLQNIDHIFVLMLENRSFDHMLGRSNISGTDPVTGTATDVDGLPAAGAVNKDVSGNSYSTTSPAPFQMPIDPPHEYDAVRLQLLGSDSSVVNYNNTIITNEGFVQSYEKAARGNPLNAVMSAFGPDQLPILNALAQEFCTCDRWFSSLPGPTVPNRLFLHAGSSKGSPKSPSVFALGRGYIDGDVSFRFPNGNIFQRLTAKGIPWTIYHGDPFPLAFALEGVGVASGRFFDRDDFAEDLEKPTLPSYIFIEPDYGSVLDQTFRGGNSQHPRDDVTGGEALLKTLYETLRASSAWDRSLLIVTYDEHGGFYDHVIPPSGVPAPGDVPNLYDFHFTQLGVRVPAIVISPWIPKNQVDHTTYDHTSVLATIRQRFPEIGFFTERDKLANDLSHLFSLATPRIDALLTLPPLARPVTSFAELEALPAGTPSVFGSPANAVQPVETPDVGFLQVAMKRDLEISSPKERRAIAAKVAKVKTNTDAKLYLREVKAKLDLKPARKAVRRKKTPTPKTPKRIAKAKRTQSSGKKPRRSKKG